MYTVSTLSCTLYTVHYPHCLLVTVAMKVCSTRSLVAKNILNTRGLTNVYVGGKKMWYFMVGALPVAKKSYKSKKKAFN